MNVIGLVAVIVASAFAGFGFRSEQISKSRLHVSQLEKEMIKNHIEILELQKEYIDLESKFSSAKDNVATAINLPKTESNERMTDTAARIKLLNKDVPSQIGDGYHLNYNNALNREVRGVQY